MAWIWVLSRAAVARHGLLHLQRGVLRDRPGSAIHQGRDAGRRGPGPAASVDCGLTFTNTISTDGSRSGW